MPSKSSFPITGETVLAAAADAALKPSKPAVKRKPAAKTATPGGVKQMQQLIADADAKPTTAASVEQATKPAAKTAAKTTAAKTAKTTKTPAVERKIAAAAEQLADVESKLKSDGKSDELIAQRDKLIVELIKLDAGYSFIAKTRGVATSTNRGLCRVLMGGKRL